MPSDRDRILSLMDSVIRNAQSAMPRGAVQSTFGGLYVAALWRSTLRTYQATLALLRQGHVTDAYSLLRVLTDNAVRLRYLAKHGDDLDSEAVKLAWASHKKRRGRLEKERRLLESDSTLPRDAYEADLEDLRRKEELILRRARDAGIEDKPPPPVGPEKMAKDVGQTSFDWVTDLTSTFVHSGDEAIFYGVKERDGVLELGLKVDDASIVSVGIAATAALMPANEVVATLLGWDTAEDVRSYSAHVRKQMHAFATSLAANPSR